MIRVRRPAAILSLALAMLLSLAALAEPAAAVDPSPTPTYTPTITWNTDWRFHHVGGYEAFDSGAILYPETPAITTIRATDGTIDGYYSTRLRTGREPSAVPSGKCEGMDQTYYGPDGPSDYCVGNMWYYWRCAAIREPDYGINDPRSNWSYGVPWQDDRKYNYEHLWKQKVVDGTPVGDWFDSGEERRAGLAGPYRISWGGCMFWDAPRTYTTICTTQVGPVYWTGPDGEGLPARNGADTGEIIESTISTGPNLIRNPDGTPWQPKSNVGRNFNDGKLFGYTGDGNLQSVAAVQGCGDDDAQELPEPLKLPSWGNFLFERTIKASVCTLMYYPGYDKWQFKGCGPIKTEQVSDYAVKKCNADPKAWNDGDWRSNFDPSLCPPHPICTWSNGSGRPATAMEPYLDSPIMLDNLGPTGTPTTVEGDGRQIIIDVPHLEMNVRGAVNPTGTCPAGTTTLADGNCRITTPYTYSWGIKTYTAPMPGKCIYDYNYTDGIADDAGTNTIDCMLPGQPVYGWVPDKTPYAWQDSPSTQTWYRDFEPKNNIAAKWTIWDIRATSSPWKDGVEDPNSPSQPFAGRVTGQRRLSLLEPGTLPKDGLPNTLGWDDTTADVLHLQYFASAERDGSATNMSTSQVRPHFAQVWREQFRMSSILAIGKIAIRYGPDWTYTENIPETCSLPYQTFRPVAARAAGGG